MILPQGAAEGLSEIMRASQVPLWAQVAALRCDFQSFMASLLGRYLACTASELAAGNVTGELAGWASYGKIEVCVPSTALPDHDQGLWLAGAASRSEASKDAEIRAPRTQLEGAM